MDTANVENHMPPELTNEIIKAAITGFEAQKTRLDAQIAELLIAVRSSNVLQWPPTLTSLTDGTVSGGIGWHSLSVNPKWSFVLGFGVNLPIAALKQPAA